jgi:acetyl-CoA/propionyl-CoA carboxylase carboxyl transferase subunit
VTADSVASPAGTDAPRDPVLRLSLFFDERSLTPLNVPNSSGVLAARGLVDGVPAIAYCTDPRLRGGAMSGAGCDHIVAAIQTAQAEGCPVTGLFHSSGASLADGTVALDGVGRVFAAMVGASGKVPQISVVLGPAAGGAAYGPALTDLVIMSGGSRVFVTGPEVVRAVTGEQVDMASLGGPEIHSRKSGFAHITTGSEAVAIARARHVVGLIARQGRFATGTAEETQDLRGMLPETARRAYDVRPVVRRILDADPGFTELQQHWAPNLVIGLGRLRTRTIGVIANNPIRKGGCLDSLSAEKGARFVRMCDSLGLPLLVLVDVPGYLPGVGQEWNGVVRRGAKLIYAFAEAVVPRVTLITRKSYGGAFIAMNSRALGATAVFAWPEAEIAIMGSDSAVSILHRKKLAAIPSDRREETAKRLADEYLATHGGVARAISTGVVDEVIDPARTRSEIASAFAAAPNSRGIHGNIPL